MFGTNNNYLIDVHFRAISVLFWPKSAQWMVKQCHRTGCTGNPPLTNKNRLADRIQSLFPPAFFRLWPYNAIGIGQLRLLFV
jgi:hypothetical protein